MKISIKKLQKIIKEEIESALKEEVIHLWKNDYGGKLTDADDVYEWLNEIGWELTRSHLRYADKLFDRPEEYTVSDFLKEHDYQLPITDLDIAIDLFHKASALLKSRQDAETAKLLGKRT